MKHLYCADDTARRMAKLTPYRIKTPEQTAIKFVTGDHVGETKPGTKFGANPFTNQSNQKHFEHICKAPYVAGESEAHSGRDYAECSRSV